MRLSDLQFGDGNPVTIATGISDKTIVGLTCDSRQVEPGFLFAALPGTHVDGREFIPEAMARGAVAVLASEGTDPGLLPADIPLFTDPNPRRQYSLAAAQFYVAQPETVVAVTGTNGKTSVAGFVRQILGGLGHKSASAGTLGIELSGISPSQAAELDVSYNLTTPDSVDLHKSLAALEELGIARLAIEASSHGLDQYRLDGIKISAGAFTNLSRDHLDYHGTLDAYLEAKLRLFSEVVVAGGAAVVNADDMYSDAFISASQRRGLQLVRYGTAGAEIELVRVQPKTNGQELQIRVFGALHEVMLPLVGRFQAENALCALGLVAAIGENIEAAIGEISTLKGIPGRVQNVAHLKNGASVYVDFAHTPEALAQVLKAIRGHTDKRLHVVFGCGGDRDPGKRPEMGMIAGKLADKVIVTDDNPRHENPATIRAAAMAGCPDAIEIPSRLEAIERAITDLASGDILIIAGKGHETGQIVGSETLPFNDVEAAEHFIAGEGL